MQQTLFEAPRPRSTIFISAPEATSCCRLADMKMIVSTYSKKRRHNISSAGSAQASSTSLSSVGTAMLFSASPVLILGFRIMILVL